MLDLSNGFTSCVKASSTLYFILIGPAGFDLVCNGLFTQSGTGMGGGPELGTEQCEKIDSRSQV